MLLFATLCVLIVYTAVLTSITSTVRATATTRVKYNSAASASKSRRVPIQRFLIPELIRARLHSDPLTALAAYVRYTESLPRASCIPHTLTSLYSYAHLSATTANSTSTGASQSPRSPGISITEKTLAAAFERRASVQFERTQRDAVRAANLVGSIFQEYNTREADRGGPSHASLFDSNMYFTLVRTIFESSAGTRSGSGISSGFAQRLQQQQGQSETEKEKGARRKLDSYEDLSNFQLHTTLNTEANPEPGAHTVDRSSPQSFPDRSSSSHTSVNDHSGERGSSADSVSHELLGCGLAFVPDFYWNASVPPWALQHLFFPYAFRAQSSSPNAPNVPNLKEEHRTLVLDAARVLDYNGLEFFAEHMRRNYSNRTAAMYPYSASPRVRRSFPTAGASPESRSKRTFGDTSSFRTPTPSSNSFSTHFSEAPLFSQSQQAGLDSSSNSIVTSSDSGGTDSGTGDEVGPAIALQAGGARLLASDEDGLWSAPALDCSFTRRWRLSYSVPVFDTEDMM